MHIIDPDKKTDKEKTQPLATIAILPITAEKKSSVLDLLFLSIPDAIKLSKSLRETEVEKFFVIIAEVAPVPNLRDVLNRTANEKIIIKLKRLASNPTKLRKGSNICKSVLSAT